jgi:predicted ribosome quality control (RQC) complex YloA/Tae2 family protein
MDNFYLSAVVREMEQEILGRVVARIFLADSDLLFDLRLAGGRALLASLDRTSPALYLSGRDLRAVNSDAGAAHPFAAQLRKRVAGGQLLGLSKDPADRVVRLEFEKYEAGGDRMRSSLVLALTGRAANAYLMDSEMNQVAALTDRAALPEHQLAELRLAELQTGARHKDLTADEFLRGVDDSMTQEEILDREFGPASIFSPVIKNEFIARCRSLGPAEAFASIVTDLLDKKPLPLVYSRLPLEEAGRRLINLKTDLLLSQIEMAQAQGMLRNEFSTLSLASDVYYSARNQQKALQNRYNSARQLIAQEIKKREAAASAIDRDRERFEDPDRLKRYGDLLLANLATARVAGAKAKVIDFYDPEQREVEIEIDENKPLQQSAAGYFSRYQKARRAITAIAVRQKQVARNLAPLKTILSELEADPTAERIAEARSAFEKATGPKRRPQRQPGKKDKGVVTGRRFKSTDGYEVLVGKNDRDNDALTFRVSKPQDVWLHAADYPGSHVIIRNPNREAVPFRTITEAAELAAFYSQAKGEGKAAVHYTQRKFVSKPPRAAPGLVRLSSFKTVLVEPRCVLDRAD